MEDDHYHLFYAYPVKYVKNGNNVEVIFHPDLQPDTEPDFSIYFPLEGGKIKFSDKVQFNYINPVAGFEISGSPSTKNTFNGSELTQVYTASDGLGEFIFQVSKDGPFGLSSFSS